MYPDFHIHTCFSDDSSTPVETAVETAAALGMSSVCITDHYDMDSPGGDFRLDTDAYVEKLKEVRERYEDRIEVLIGVELGLEPHLNGTGEAERYLAQYPFDYTICSVHFVDRADPYFRDRLAMTDEVMYRRYFEQLLDVVCGNSGFRTVGHLDYIARCGYDGGESCVYANYRELLDAILEEIVRRDLILEVNTAGYRKGLAYPNPHADILRRYRELGGERVILGSDAHFAADIGADFDRAAELLRSLGFRALTMIGRGVEKQVPL